MLLVFCVVVAMIFAGMAIVGAKGWKMALQNGSEEDVVQNYRKVFYRSAGLVVLVGTLAAASLSIGGQSSNSKPNQSAMPPSSKINTGIS